MSELNLTCLIVTISLFRAWEIVERVCTSREQLSTESSQSSWYKEETSPWATATVEMWVNNLGGYDLCFRWELSSCSAPSKSQTVLSPSLSYHSLSLSRYIFSLYSLLFSFSLPLQLPLTLSFYISSPAFIFKLNQSIYGGSFKDENFIIGHTQPGTFRPNKI